MTYLYTTPGIRGIGDALFLSAIAKVWRQRHPHQPIAVRNKNFELFYNNSDVDVLVCGYEQKGPRGPVFLKRERAWLPQIVGTRWSIIQLAESMGLFGGAWNAKHGWPPRMNLLLETAEKCGLHLTPEEQVSLRPYYWPYISELSHAADLSNTICVQSTAATYWTVNKQWPVERWQAVVNRLATRFKIVQLGSAEDYPLNKVIDLRGKTTLRETAAILANARLFIGMEGGLMHLACAVDTRAVIVFTGFITPEYSGYNVNVNLFGPVERTDLPCWNLAKCQCDCAERVTVDDVVRGVEDCLARPLLPKHYHTS